MGKWMFYCLLSIRTQIIERRARLKVRSNVLFFRGRRDQASPSNRMAHFPNQASLALAPFNVYRSGDVMPRELHARLHKEVVPAFWDGNND